MPPTPRPALEGSSSLVLRQSQAMLMLLLALLLVGACSRLPAIASMQPAPTAPPAPAEGSAAADAPPPEQFGPLPAGALVAGVDVGGLEHAAATEKLNTELAGVIRPLELHLDEASLILYPDDIGVHIPTESLLALARSQAASGSTVNVPLDVQFDTLALSDQLSLFAEQTALPPTIGIESTTTISRSFTTIPGRAINVNNTMILINEHLRSPGADTTITLQRSADPTLPRRTTRADVAQLQQQVEEIAAAWDGVVGFYLYDLESGETVVLNEHTVFSGASVMKVAIMLQVYTTLPELTKQQRRWMRKMIVESDNKAANALLAASAGGTTLEDALTGVRQMNRTLQKLGLEYTFQKLPYESAKDFPKLYEEIEENTQPYQGRPPFTETDPIIQTTPAEMSRLFLAIDACSRGAGDLLNLFPGALTPARCADMLNWLAMNEDDTRMRAGFPPGLRVEHKSGWIEDMQTDVGIVRSPGGDFLLAIYLYEDISLHDDPKYYLDDKRATPMIAALARIAYTAYNPVDFQ